MYYIGVLFLLDKPHFDVKFLWDCFYYISILERNDIYLIDFHAENLSSFFSKRKFFVLCFLNCVVDTWPRFLCNLTERAEVVELKVTISYRAGIFCEFN